MQSYRLVGLTVLSYCLLELSSIWLDAFTDDQKRFLCWHSCKSKITKTTTFKNDSHVISLMPESLPQFENVMQEKSSTNSKKKNVVAMRNNIINSNSLKCETSESARMEARQSLLPTQVNERTSNCSTYFDSLFKVIYPNESPRGTEFPHHGNGSDGNPKLAFTIITHDQIGLFEILLHLVFRPWNAYCIYIGADTDPKYLKNMKKLLNCYHEKYPDTALFLAENVGPVQWGNYSLIEADFKCMEQLLQLKTHHWRYLVNLAGTELPLYSVDELAVRLRQTRAKIATDSFHLNNFDKRFKFRYQRICTTNADGSKRCALKRKGKKDKPPFGLEVFKGYKNVILRRDMADFIINHPVAKTFREFMKDTLVPDEHIYATLSKIKKINFVKNPLTGLDVYQVKQKHGKASHVQDGLCQRISIWDHWNFYYPVRKPYRCRGKYIRRICHLSMEDMKEVYKRNTMSDGRQNCFIANKFDVRIDSNAILCTARRIHLQEYITMEKKPF